MRFGLQLRAADPTTVAGDARRAEELGFDVVVVGDHIGSDDWGPLLCLAAAASATSTIRLGTLVLNASLQHPLQLAREVATLDQLSGGRVELGLGAGHTPAEFAASGVAFEPAATRKRRLAELIELMRALLDGETVDHRGEHFELTGAQTGPAAQAHLPILVGGSGAGLLAHAACHADIVGLAGLGRTLPDGHRHVARFGVDDVDHDVSIVRRAAEGAGRDPELNVLLQAVDVTDDRQAAAAAMVDRIEGLSIADALATPFLALGSHEQIAEHLVAAAHRWGIGYVVVREAESFAPVIDLVRRGG